MTARQLACGLLAAAGIWIGPSASAQEPARITVLPGQALARPEASLNQSMADTIADQLRQSAQLRHYMVNISFANGRAELTGSVSDSMQREEVLRIVQGVPGVETVVENLALTSASPITQVQAPPAPLAAGAVQPPPAGVMAGAMQEPVPIFQAPAPSPYDVNSPRMPPYAWPTYAPYNNYSRVAYPEAYPYNSWPFIGPVYPFPKIPLGWRSVKLEWEDGYWWFSRVGNSHNWWRLRYW